LFIHGSATGNAEIEAGSSFELADTVVAHPDLPTAATFDVQFGVSPGECDNGATGCPIRANQALLTCNQVSLVDLGAPRPLASACSATSTLTLYSATSDVDAGATTLLTVDLSCVPGTLSGSSTFGSDYNGSVTFRVDVPPTTVSAATDAGMTAVQLSISALEGEVTFQRICVWRDPSRYGGGHFWP
jgi:hypothetical protein